MSNLSKLWNDQNKYSKDTKTLKTHFQPASIKFDWVSNSQHEYHYSQSLLLSKLESESGVAVFYQLLFYLQFIKWKLILCNKGGIASCSYSVTLSVTGSLQNLMYTVKCNQLPHTDKKVCCSFVNSQFFTTNTIQHLVLSTW